MVGELLTLAATTSVASLLTTYGAIWPTSQMFGKTICHTTPGNACLTFDDGPSEWLTDKILDVLPPSSGTFFVLGNRVRQHRSRIKRILSQGHSIGTHTMTHRSLVTLPSDEIVNELLDSQHAIEDVAGIPVTLFRPPFGARSPLVLDIAEGLGLDTVMWNVSTFDWQEEVLYHNIVERAAKRVASEGKKGRGAIILMHDGPTQQIKTAIAVKKLVGILQKDFKLTTVDN